ncbi:hypothetical protein BFJ69_g16055 [Fusarium oxysporum]|uniref:BTB domain-containing protein n=1 Tax=Fusarium oxysporum TaxID=5507 RepID=A0A420MCD1_FUSOX|nr:hypothetical protein BFJ69_g16055 [Fusarium oxysporum]
MEEHMKECRKWFGELFQTGDYSDIRLLCDNKTYNAHRVVVFCQSPYIKNGHNEHGSNSTGSGQAFGSRTNSTPEFRFWDRDTQAVDCVVQYFYRWDYEILGHARDAKVGTGVMHEDATDDTMIPLGSDLITHVRVFALAEKYGIRPLKSLSVAKFEAAAQHYGKTHYFADAAREAYESDVPDNVREMRDSIV